MFKLVRLQARNELGRVFKIGQGRVDAQPFRPGFFCLLASSLARHVAAAMLLTRFLARRQNPSRRGLVLF